MSSGLYAHTTRGVGTVLTAAIYNADHSNHVTNHNPTMIGAYSDAVVQMQAMTSPGGLGTEALAGSLGEELERLRFVIARLQGTTHWYQAPVTTLATIGGGVPLSLAFAATPLTLRRTENTTAEVEYESIQSGSGVGLKYSRRLVGTGANAVSEIRDYIGTVELWRHSATLKTQQILQHFNLGWQVGAAGLAKILADISGFMQFAEMAAPANPAVDHLRLYARDVSGVTRLCYRDSTGAEFIITTPDVSGLAPKGQMFDEVITKTADYVFALTDVFKLIVQSGASTQKLTIPLNSTVAFPIGTRLYFRFSHADNTGGLALAGGVTLYSPQGNTPTSGGIIGPDTMGGVGVYTMFHTMMSSVTKIGTDTWNWDSRITQPGGAGGDGGGGDG